MDNRYHSWRANAAEATTVNVVMDDAARNVLRNTYMLLSLCLGFSALTAGAAIVLQLPYPGLILTLLGYFGLLYMVNRNRTSGAGVAWTFALTGFMGYTLGPIVGLYLRLPNGGMTVMMALAATAAIFLTLSAYALMAKRDLSFLGGFLSAGVMVAFLASLAAIFLQIPAMSLGVSALFVLLMSGMILFETNQIVRGGETNYIMATVSLFVSLFNLFTSLLQILGFVNNSD
ncbi:MAG: yccA [Burkholderiaceae bacterium]|nr:yccA [Burkholderiaceae bacterium]